MKTISRILLSFIFIFILLFAQSEMRAGSIVTDSLSLKHIDYLSDMLEESDKLLSDNKIEESYRLVKKVYRMTLRDNTFNEIHATSAYYLSILNYLNGNTKRSFKYAEESFDLYISLDPLIIGSDVPCLDFLINYHLNSPSPDLTRIQSYYDKWLSSAITFYGIDSQQYTAILFDICLQCYSKGTRLNTLLRVYLNLFYDRTKTDLNSLSVENLLDLSGMFHDMKDWSKMYSVTKTCLEKIDMTVTNLDKIQGLTQRIISYAIEFDKPYLAIKPLNNFLDIIPNTNHKLRAECNYHLGLVCEKSEDKLEYLTTALELAKISEDLHLQGLCQMELGTLYFNQDIIKSEEYYSDALTTFIALKNLKKCADVCINLSLVYGKEDKEEFEIEYAQFAIDIYKSLKNNEKLANAHSVLGSAYKRNGQFYYARKEYQASADLYRITNQTSSLKMFDRIRDAYINAGDQELVKRTLYQKLEFLKTDSTSLYLKERIDTRFRISSIINSEGQFVKALRIRQDLLKDIDKVYGKESITYAFMLRMIANIYDDLGSFQEAEEYYHKAESLFQNLLFTKNHHYALNELSILYKDLAISEERKKNFEKAEKYCDMALEYTDSTNYRDLSNIYSVRADLKLKNGDSSALQDLNHTNKLNKLYFGTDERINAVNHEIDKARFYMDLGNTSKSYHIYKKYYDFALHEFDHMSLIPFLINSIKVYTLKGDSRIDFLAENLTETLTSEIIENLPLMTEAERLKYINQLYTIEELFLRVNDNNNISKYIYDLTVLFKGLLQRTCQTQWDYIQTKNNSEEYRCLEEYINAKRDFYAYKLSSHQNSVMIDSLYNNYYKSEVVLLNTIESLDDLKNYYKCGYDEIVSSLKIGEVAVEFLCVGEEKNYFALVAQPNQKIPHIYYLFNESELSGFLSKKPFVILRNTASCSEIYDMIWKKIECEIKDKKSIYFSPDGFMFSFPIEYTLKSIPGFQDIRIKRLSSTKEIALKQNDRQQQQINVDLYGGIDYDLTVEENTQKDTFSFTSTRDSWRYLPHSLSEVKQISKILKRSKISCNIHTGRFAKENNFFESSKDASIIHIATHGFYIPQENVNLKEMLYDEPLLRSGLLLSGGGTSWKKRTLSLNDSDGILMSYEIKNLYFKNLDLVVLSACRTGLGDVNHDGVKGLQCAFKNAGAKSLIMSLWDIDDAATMEMMTTFYEYLTFGLTKEESFTKAISKLKEKYPDPYYWASFIMLD